MTALPRLAMLAPMQLIIISGLSGSGKSIALNVLEDSGYYCVDNLPAQLLRPLIEQLSSDGYGDVAVAVDMRSGASTAGLPAQLRELRGRGIESRFIFIDARDEVLIQRFSETRRRHPLANQQTTLAEAIVRERDGLENIAGLGHHIDTSNLQPNALRAFVKDFALLGAQAAGVTLTLLFESFGYKNGLPLDADLVFDVRCLPNPHYDPELRSLTGRDAAVVGFLESQSEVERMYQDIRRYIADWLPAYIRDSRSYLTVAIGCTGGQHRSVYLAERLANHFGGLAAAPAQVLVRHRGLPA